MITAIREVRRAKRLTLDEVAQRCLPPTTAQTIGRLETGTRTVSVAWLNRIALALGVEASDLVRLPARPDIPVAALLDADGAAAPRRPATLVPPQAEPELVAVVVTASTGEYRAGDELWCRRLPPPRFAEAMHRDVLVPESGGRYRFGRLLRLDDRRIEMLAPGPSGRPLALAAPPWLAVATRLIRTL